MNIKIDHADSLFSKWIRNRDSWQCQRCLRKYEENDQRLQNSHFYGRGHESTRFEPANCDALCFGCHQFFTSHPMEYVQWKTKQLGEDRMASLALQANQYHKKDRAFEALKWKLALQQDFNL